MEIITARGCTAEGQEQQHRGRRRRKPSDGHVVAQLLDSPLPTPRRSCCGSAAGTPRSARAASPQRTHVPFSWESSPGVPKAGGASLERGWLPPRPPPGRFGGGRAYHGGNTTDATSSDDDDDTFSDALDRISSSDRLAALSARLSSIDGRAASRRLSSFIMDRFLPAATAIARTSTEKRAKKSPRRAACRSEQDDEEEEAPAAARLETHTPRRERHAPALQQEEESWNGTPPQEIAWRHEEEARGDETPPRACGFTVLFPWCVKPVLCGFPWSPARPRMRRASPPRRSTTMGDVLVKELGLRTGDPSHWHEDKMSGSGKEWSSPGGPGLGTSILGTSRRYCADARKALSRLARSATDAGGGGSGSPRISRERRSGKAASSPLHSTSSGRMPQLQVKPPSESWLCHARGSTTVNSRR
ncbi:hypothetical protein ZWY2020_043918 [Hordeum vulgare]|nr:hypothetical protein ZWY2020_043918 [Hordeum vulgare]